MPIRPAHSGDLTAIARIHKSQFPTHFLGQYSVQLLAKFYGNFLARSVFLVHLAGDEITGFVLGGEGGQLLSCKAMFIRTNLPRCILETIPRWHIWHASIQRGVLAFRAAQVPRGQHRDRYGKPSFCLLSIAVNKQTIGTGVAAALVKAFEAKLTGKAAGYRLSVAKHNTRAIAFYHKMGFQITDDSGSSLTFYRILGSSPQSNLGVPSKRSS